MFNIEVKSVELEKALHDAGRRCKYTNDMWEEIGEEVVRSVKKNFDVGGRPKKWKKLKKKTIEARQRDNILSTQPLIRTKSLMDDVKHRVIGDGVLIGNMIEYSFFHNLGTKFIDQREYLLVQKEDEREIEHIIEKEITEPLK